MINKVLVASFIISLSFLSYGEEAIVTAVESVEQPAVEQAAKPVDSVKLA